MRLSSTRVRLAAASALLAGTLGGGLATGAPAKPVDAPTPGIACDKGSLPEKVQGRAPAADFASGRALKGYTCNAREISHSGVSGGFRVERYVDKAGHECAYYDTTALFGTNLADQGADGPGTYVLDMSNPAEPIHTDTLRTPAFSSPHETLRVNAARGLIAAVFSTPAVAPGTVDIFDISQDCRHPVLKTSTPFGILGHESGWAPDGMTFYSASLYGHTVAAIDVSDLTAPKLVWVTTDYQSHGLSISDDGNTLFMAEAPYDDSTDFQGLTILDVSEVQKRVLNPKVPIISRLTWPTVSTPQNATPFTSRGRRYVLETDEFGEDDKIGGARIIDVHNLAKPFVVSDLRLAVNQAKLQPEIQDDPGNAQPFQGYQAHYCSLPSRVDPQIVACSFILSGLRVFDISNVARPKEIAYHNRPIPKGPFAQGMSGAAQAAMFCVPGASTAPIEAPPSQQARAGGFAMSAPAYDQASGDIWYTDANSGFYVVRLTGAARRAKFAPRISYPGN